MASQSKIKTTRKFYGMYGNFYTDVLWHLPDLGGIVYNWSLLPSNDATWRPKSGATLDQVMASHLFGAKPLPESMSTYCH